MAAIDIARELTQNQELMGGVIAALGALFALIATACWYGVKKLRAAMAHLGEIKTQVANNHNVNLRDDLDRQNATVLAKMGVLEAMTRQQGDQINHLTSTVNVMASGLEMVRANAAKEHDEIRAESKRRATIINSKIDQLAETINP